ncbi:hypothetical protein [Verminephrobacter aporrectodeae]|uniref:hypothetical protein n=1 Tax=Verminephrobacter aporrectodeae TaxID=1110389 RepID=UPI00110FFABF|nr:hypothetical protein [Verminephrobacter aporrectodeae]
MKPSTLHSLIIARTLHDEARRLIAPGDRHMSSAGLILLQDVLELVFLSMLMEMEQDAGELKKLESMRFDELIKALKKIVPEIDSVIITVLNKQRVIAKHYGQPVDPAAVQTYLDFVDSTVEKIVEKVLHREYREIFLSDLLKESDAQAFLSDAALQLDQGNFFETLLLVRKAIFVEIEIEYCVHEWSDIDSNEQVGLFSAARRGGSKAPYRTRNREWIQKNVTTPFEYIQIDYDNLRIDAMEWGVNTAELDNLLRLTPNVFRSNKDAQWHVQRDLLTDDINAKNSRYCLDRAISVLLQKQQHSIAHRRSNENIDYKEFVSPPSAYLGAMVFPKARQEPSESIHIITDQYRYSFLAWGSGFNPEENYYTIIGLPLPTEGRKFGDFSLSRMVQGFLLDQGDGKLTND